MPEQESKCPFCGTKIEAGFNVCRGCGAEYIQVPGSFEGYSRFFLGIATLLIGFIASAFIGFVIGMKINLLLGILVLLIGISIIGVKAENIWSPKKYKTGKYEWYRKE